MTGVASASLNHTPLVVITPAVLSGAIGTKAFQEVDQMRMLAPLVTWQTQVNRPERMGEAIRGAFRAAIATRGPVQVDIPRDAWYGEWDDDERQPETYRTDGRYGGAPAMQCVKQWISLRRQNAPSFLRVWALWMPARATRSPSSRTS